MTASNQDLDGLRAVLKVLEDRGGWGRGALDVRWAIGEIEQLRVQFTKYRQALYQANGFLIMRGLEPVKLEYPTDTSTNDPAVTSANGSVPAHETTAVTGETVQVTDDMVTRFLGWRLPKDFAPDGGVTFTPINHPACWPIGTNLLTADQARAMLEHVLADKTSDVSRSSLKAASTPTTRDETP